MLRSMQISNGMDRWKERGRDKGWEANARAEERTEIKWLHFGNRIAIKFAVNDFWAVTIFSFWLPVRVVWSEWRQWRQWRRIVFSFAPRFRPFGFRVRFENLLVFRASLIYYCAQFSRLSRRALSTRQQTLQYTIHTQQSNRKHPVQGKPTTLNFSVREREGKRAITRTMESRCTSYLLRKRRPEIAVAARATTQNLYLCGCERAHRTSTSERKKNLI